MRRPTTTGSAMIALGVALHGCAGILTPEPIPPVAADMTPENQPTNWPALASNIDAAVRQARLQRTNGDLDAATRTLGQLLLVAPDDPRVVGEYGKTLVAKGHSDDALAFLARALELQPGDWTLHSAQGVAYDQKAEYGAAKVAYERALALKPGEASVLSNAGLSRMQAGDLDAAEMLLAQALAMGGENQRISSNLALVARLRASRGMAPAAEPGFAGGGPAAPLAAMGAAENIATMPIPPPAAAVTTEPLSGYSALAADPTVRMAPIPRQDAPVQTSTAATQAREAPRPLADEPQVTAAQAPADGFLRRIDAGN